MTNMVEACAKADTRLVFIDNLYQLGPQESPRTEEMPLAAMGEKPMILAEVTRIWQAARDRVKVAALRCSDFYGPGVAASHLGALAFGELAKNGRHSCWYEPTRCTTSSTCPIPHGQRYCCLMRPTRISAKPGTCHVHQPGVPARYSP